MLSRKRRLALLVPSIFMIAACGAPPGERLLPSTESAITISPIRGNPPIIIAPAFVAPTYYTATAGRVIPMQSATESICLLQGVRGDFSGPSSVGWMYVANGNYYLAANGGAEVTPHALRSPTSRRPEQTRLHRRRLRRGGCLRRSRRTTSSSANAQKLWSARNRPASFRASRATGPGSTPAKSKRTASIRRRSTGVDRHGQHERIGPQGLGELLPVPGAVFDHARRRWGRLRDRTADGKLQRHAEGRACGLNDYAGQMCRSEGAGATAPTSPMTQQGIDT